MGLDKLHVLRAIPFTTEYLKELKGTTKPFFQRRAPADQKDLSSEMFRNTLKTSILFHIEHGSGMEEWYWASCQIFDRTKAKMYTLLAPIPIRLWAMLFAMVLYPSLFLVSFFTGSKSWGQTTFLHRNLLCFLLVYIYCEYHLSILPPMRSRGFERFTQNNLIWQDSETRTRGAWISTLYQSTSCPGHHQCLTATVTWLWGGVGDPL